MLSPVGFAHPNSIAATVWIDQVNTSPIQGAYNGFDVSWNHPHEDPLWLAYERSRDFITAAKPKTVEGMLAKARAAKAEAMGLDEPDNPYGTPAERWAWDLVTDMLKLWPSRSEQHGALFRDNALDRTANSVNVNA